MYPAAPRIPHGWDPVCVRSDTYAGIGVGVGLAVGLPVGPAVGLAVGLAVGVTGVTGVEAPPQPTSATAVARAVASMRACRMRIPQEIHHR